MQLTHDSRFARTDIWREGKWLDLWSVVHLLSGVTLGLLFSILPFNALSAVVIAFLLLTAYELWEAMVQIYEAPTNRVMDVVVGMASFLPTYFYLDPGLMGASYILVFGGVLTVNVVFSIFGWVESKKAAVLQERLRQRAEMRRIRRMQRKLLKDNPSV